MKNIIPILTVILLIAAACNSDTDEALSFTRIDGKRVPTLNFDNINSDPVEIGISQLITGFKVIPLETKEECMIEYAHPYFSDNNLLISTQRFPGAAPLFMFDIEGRFIREVGSGGNGPGEHSGYVVENVITDPEFGTIFVNFQNVLQLFNTEGNFIRRVKQPMDFRENAYRLDQDTWFSPGMAADYALRANDSVLIVFYDEAGNIISKTDRNIYPPKSMSGYTPSGWDRTVYKYDDSWRIYLPGTDTLFRLEGKKMIPELIFNTGENGMKYNSIMTQSEVIGSFDLSVIAETDNYYLIRMGTIIEAEIVEYREGVWGGRFNPDFELILIEKSSNKAQKIVIVDDLYELCDKRFLNGGTEISENRWMPYPLLATDIKSKATEIFARDDISQEVKQRVADINSKITLDSNPVILLFSLKDKIEL